MAETSLKRSELRHAYRQASQQGSGLLEVLDAGHAAARATINGGRFTTSVSGGGISRTMATDRRVTPGDMLEAYEELLTLYDTAVVHVGATDDSAIYAEMLALLVPAREVSGDFSALRL